MTEFVIGKLFIQAATLGLASIFSKVICEGSGKLIGWTKERLDEKTEKQIEKAAIQYVQNYCNRHGILKVLGMREPVDLESVYTTVQFLDRRGLQSLESIESMEQAYRRSRRFEPKESRRQDGIKVANDKPFLMVLGGPGAGKSTFLRKMGLEALKGRLGKYEHECIPVFLELKGVTSNPLDIEQAIVHEFQVCGFPSSAACTAKLLEQGRLLVLLDGLDEVPSKNVNDVICQIQDFVDRYDNNRFIASCRVAAYRHNFRRFTDVAIADFDGTQIEQFINNWFNSTLDREVGTGQRCWEILQKPEHAAAKELAQTPLLLTLLCLVYDHSQNFPKNRSGLYRKALRILLEEWASEKRILQEEIYQGLSTELEEILLSDIAYHGFEADRLFFAQRELVDHIKTFLTSNLNAPKHLNGEGVLNAIAIQQGILVERAEEVFSFSHLTLQEYLTAQFIEDHHQVGRLVSAHLTDERWQEVFLLVAGLMRGGADELLLRMERKARKLINTPKLTALLAWAEQVTVGSAGVMPAPTKRSAAIFLALMCDRALHLSHSFDPEVARVLDLARTLARAGVPEFIYTMNNTPARASTLTRAFARAFTHTFARELEKLKVFNNIDFNVLIARLEAFRARKPDIRQSPEAHQDFNFRLSQIWLNALQLDSNLISLFDEELQSLEHYLYANWLIVRCRQAAVRLSPQIWQAIEDRMLKGEIAESIERNHQYDT
ncbi:MAG: NACHT domain-containing protein [Scytolyngbya sp. HA4215-MV1]|jgi:hypothetical protein|nr:NACHT domain-containing protein [Scytolyngbya sp. HA4215-MV1]